MPETTGQHWVVHFTGRVQGVGFRWTTRNVARQYTVAGYVMNLHDGRVILECEGEPDELKLFIVAILEAMSGYVTDHTIDRWSATDQFGTPQPGAVKIRR